MADKKPIFSLKQGIGLLLFLAFVFILRLFIHFLPKPENANLSLYDTLPYPSRSEQTVIRLQPFDPNTADSLTLLQVGLRPWQIKNLMNYRKKGGRFRHTDDFRRLYGLTDSAFLALRPYIAIDTIPFFHERQEYRLRDSLRRDSIRQRYNLRKDSLQQLYTLRHDSIEQAYQTRRDSLLKAGKIHIKKDTVIELNTADTNDLQYIRGIGSYTARQIIRYREQLGGYHRHDQLRELTQLDYASWDSIIPHLTVDTALIRKINVQTASVERLSRHPYIRFTQAKNIYETRRRKIHLTGMQDLCPAVLTQEEADRLKPYLDFTLPPKHDRRSAPHEDAL